MPHKCFMSFRALAVLTLSCILTVAAVAQDAGAQVAKDASKSADTSVAKPKPDVKTAAVPSTCKGLDVKTCSGNAGCKWIVPTKVNAKTGKISNPYCRKAPKPPACKGLDQTACGAKSECGWTVPKKADAKTGKIPDAFCRKAPKTSAKKAAGYRPATSSAA